MPAEASAITNLNEARATPPASTPPTSTSPAAPAIDVIAAIVALVAFLPFFVIHGHQLWQRPHYQFFPFILLGSAVLAWSRWNDVERREPGNPLTAAILFAVSWALLVLAEIVFSPALAVLGALVFLAAGIVRVGGWPLFKAMLPAWIFLWLMIPLPFGLDRQLVLGMQTLTSVSSSFMLDWFGVIHKLSGNVVEIAGRQLLVEQACAGVNSLFAILACSLFLILFLRRHWFRAILLIAASIFWVLVTNVIRVGTIAIASDRFNIDLSTGLRHELLGLACFFLAVLLVWSTDRLFLFFKPSWNDDVAEPVRGPAPASSAATGVVAFCPWPIAAAFAIPLVMHVAVHGIMPAALDTSILPTMAAINRDSLPEKLGNNWTLVNYGDETRTTNSSFGEFSKTWIYKRGNNVVVLSLDYPFAEYHDLWECYAGTGWSLVQKTPHLSSTAMPSYWAELTMSKPGLQNGYLLFSEFNPKGETLPYESRWAQALHRYEYALTALHETLTKSGGATPPKLRGPAYQFQAFTNQNGPFDEFQKAEIQNLYFAALNILHPKLFGSN